MELFPAIDLQAGRCVRLKQGDFDAVTVYDADPLNAARGFVDAGAHWLHVVDLDGARAGKMQQHDVIMDIAQEVPLKLQVGGGIRDEGMIEKLLSIGVQRVVIGSLAVKNRPLVIGWLNQFGPERIVLALDVKLNEKGDPEVLTHGWQSGGGISLWNLLADYKNSGLQTILCTDVGRDGMMAGSNRELYALTREKWPDLEILASGGVNDLEDLLALKALGVAGAVVGKAIYEGKIDVAAALRLLGQVKGEAYAS